MFSNRKKNKRVIKQDLEFETSERTHQERFDDIVDKSDLPDRFKCARTGKIMNDPVTPWLIDARYKDNYVVYEHNQTFDREALMERYVEVELKRNEDSDERSSYFDIDINPQDNGQKQNGTYYREENAIEINALFPNVLDLLPNQILTRAELNKVRAKDLALKDEIDKYLTAKEIAQAKEKAQAKQKAQAKEKAQATDSLNQPSSYSFGRSVFSFIPQHKTASLIMVGAIGAMLTLTKVLAEGTKNPDDPSSGCNLQ